MDGESAPEKNSNAERRKKTSGVLNNATLIFARLGNCRCSTWKWCSAYIDWLLTRKSRVFFLEWGEHTSNNLHALSPSFFWLPFSLPNSSKHCINLREWKLGFGSDFQWSFLPNEILEFLFIPTFYTLLLAGLKRVKKSQSRLEFPYLYYTGNLLRIYGLSCFPLQIRSWIVEFSSGF